MNNTHSPAHPAAGPKKRARRESRRFTEGSAASTAFATNELIKALTKTPTRNIPDILGFTILTKTEIKKDTKEIEKACGLMTSVDGDGEMMMDMSISRSLRPSSNPESSLSKKRSRLETWSATPELADQEVQLWQQKVVKAKDAFLNLDSEIELWHESFQATRKVLHAAQLGCTDSNNVLRVEAGQLLTLCEKELATDARKKRAFQLKDAADELIERQSNKLDLVKKIESFVSENSGASLPTVVLSINELDHPQLFNSKTVLASSDGSSAASESVAMDVNTETAVKNETSAPVEESTQPAEAVHTDEELLAILTSLQESVRSGESGLRELDAFFLSEKDEEDLVALETVLKGRQSASAVETQDNVALTAVQEKLTQGVLALNGRVDLWTQHVSRVLDSQGGAQQGTTTRKKKRGGEGAVPLKAGVRSHTEYDTCLLLSPLSQYPDRVLGSVQNVNTLYVKCTGEDGAEASFKNITQLPSEIVQAEDDAMERCRLQSCAAAAELKLNQLRQVSLDLRRTATDSSNALKRSEYMYLQALHEDASERRRIRKELVFYGIAPVHATDPPMSPLHHAQTSSSQFNGVGVNKNAFRTSAANRSRSANSRANGIVAANILSKGTARYMNNGFQANPAQSSFDTSSPARGSRGGANSQSAAPTAPARSSRYSNITTAVAVTTTVAPAATTFAVPVENKRRGNGRSAPAAAALQTESVHAEESVPANKRRGGGGGGRR